MTKRILRAVTVLYVMLCARTQWQNNGTALQKHNNFEQADSTHRGSDPDNWHVIPQRSTYSRMASAICWLVPSTCSSLEKIFELDAAEARGPRDLIAIVSTMLAALLGAILVKLGVLIVLSVISVAIGKLLLVVLSLKTHHKSYPQPIIYEKVYYPHGSAHRDWRPHAGHPYLDDVSAYDQPHYQR